MNKQLTVYNPTSMQEVTTTAQLFAESGMFSDVKGMAQAFVKIMAGGAMGFDPFSSMNGVHIIQGKPTIGAGLIAAAVQAHPDFDFDVQVHTDHECSIKFLKLRDGVWMQAGISTFTMDDANNATVYKKGKWVALSSSNTWKSYPRNMLYARAMSNGARWYCAAVFGGSVYVPEELGADVDEEGDIILNPQIERALDDIAVKHHDEPVRDSSQNQAEIIEVQGLDLDVLAVLPDSDTHYHTTLINALHSLSGFSEESLVAWLRKNGIDLDVPDTDAFSLFEMRLIDNYEADTDYLLDGDRSFLKEIEGRETFVLLPFETFCNVNALAATFSSKVDQTAASKPQIAKLVGLIKELFTFYEDDPAEEAFAQIATFLFPEAGDKLRKREFRAILGWLESADGFYPAVEQEANLILTHVKDKQAMLQ